MAYDVVALGELLVDFAASNEPDKTPCFKANAGGAPCNVLALLARLGHKTTFVGKVGQDMFGELLCEALKEASIDTSHLLREAGRNTTLAFVSNDSTGDRSFSFYRHNGADTYLRKADIDVALIQDCSILHFGSLSLTHEPALSATKYAVGIARETDTLISFDPNYRPALWQGETKAKREILWGLSVADIVKLSDEEVLFLTGEEDMATGVKRLRKEFPNIKLLLVTSGVKGSEAFVGDVQVWQPTFSVDTVDTTGAGDTFFAACLHYVLCHGLPSITSAAALKDMLRFSNAAAALITTKIGALSSMPTEKEIQYLLLQDA